MISRIFISKLFIALVTGTSSHKRHVIVRSPLLFVHLFDYQRFLHRLQYFVHGHANRVEIFLLLLRLERFDFGKYPGILESFPNACAHIHVENSNSTTTQNIVLFLLVNQRHFFVFLGVSGRLLLPRASVHKLQQRELLSRLLVLLISFLAFSITDRFHLILCPEHAQRIEPVSR